MRVDLLGLVLIEGDEAVEDVVASSSVIGSTFTNIRLLMLPTVGSDLVKLAFIIREIILHRRNRKFLLKPIDLVQEQDDRGLDEPPGVADGVE